MIAILHRDLVSNLRSWRALGLQVLFVLALGVLVLLRWPADAQVDVDGRASREVLRVFGYGLMVGLMLVCPAFPATSIVRERVQGTLALLLNAPLHPAGIVAAKFLAAIGVVLLLLTLSLPAAAACFAMGGASLSGQIGGLLFVLGLLGVQYSSLGLLVSSSARSTDSALRITYAAIFMMAFVVLVPGKFVVGASWATPELVSLTEWLRCISPVPAVMERLGDTGVGSDGVVIGAGASGRFAILAVLSSLGCLAGAMYRLSRRPLDRGRSAGQMTDDRSRSVRASRRILYLWFFDPQRRSGPIAPWQNPVMVKEQRCRRFGRGNWMMRLIGVYLVLSLLLVLAATTMSQAQGVSSVLSIVAIMQVGLILLLAPSLAAGLISSEREGRGWQLLQMTPMSTATIVVGKLLSAAVPLLLVLLSTLPAFAVMVFFDPGMLRTALSVLTTLLLFALMSILLSAAVGSLFRQTASATAAAYAVLLIICAGSLMFWLGQDAPFSFRLVESVLIANPLAATLSQIGAPGFAQYALVPGNWYFVGALAALGLVLLWIQVRRLSSPR